MAEPEETATLETPTSKDARRLRKHAEDGGVRARSASRGAQPPRETEREPGGAAPQGT